MKYRSAKARFLAMLLVMAMVVGFFPAKTQAAEGSFVLGEGKTITLEPGETVSYMFTPEEAGKYAIYSVEGNRNIDFTVDTMHAGSTVLLQGDAGCYGKIIELKEGYEYLIVFNSYVGQTASDTFYINKVAAATALEMPSECTMYVDSSKRISVDVDPFLGYGNGIVWSSSDPEIVDVSPYSLSMCDLVPQKTGTATITATAGDISANCTVNVINVPELKLDETVEITRAQSRFTFTPEETGEYWLWWPNGEAIAQRFDVEAYEYITDERHGFVYKLTEGQSYEIELWIPDDEQWPQVTPVTLTQVHKATDLVFPQGDTIIMPPNRNASYPMEWIGGEIIGDVWIESNNPDVAWINNNSRTEFEVHFNQPGETTFTFTTSFGIEKTLTVICADYGYDALVNWTGYQEPRQAVRLEYTPEHDGFYFFNSYYGMSEFFLTADSAQPLNMFDWDDNGYYGTVYQMEAGKTYSWESCIDYYREYDIYLHEVEASQSVALPETISGKVNERIWLEITLDGAGSTELSCDNPDVALLGSGNAVGNEVYLIGEGTAVITCTDYMGNVDTCTVIAEGIKTEQTFWGGELYALGAGKSMTYTYTPEQTGLYWISTSSFNHKTDPASFVYDASGNEMAGYEYNAWEETGKVYELTAGTTYLLKTTSDESQIFWLNSRKVEEATGIELYDAEYIGLRGDVIEREFRLTGNMEATLAGQIAVTSSNSEVAKVLSYTAERFKVQLVGEGTAEITIALSNGSTASFMITATGVESAVADEKIDINLAHGETVTYEFIPEESGAYVLILEGEQSILFNPSWTSDGDEDFLSHVWNSDAEGLRGYIGYHMDAGERYIIRIEHPDWYPDDIAASFKIEKTGKVTDFEIYSYHNAFFVGDHISFRNQFSSYLAMDGEVDWEVSGNAKINWETPLECSVLFNEAGTYTITATCGDLVRTYTVTVKEVGILELDSPVKVTKEEVKYQFTAEEAGDYWFWWPQGDSMSFNIMTSCYSFENSYGHGHVAHLNTGETCQMFLNVPEEWDHEESQITVTKVQEAEDISYDETDKVIGICYTNIQIPIQLVGGEVAKGLSATSDNEDVAYVERCTGSYIELYLMETGKANITVSMSNGAQATIEVECAAYGYDAVAKWSAIQWADTTERLTFTPDQDGFYFLNSQNGNDGFEIAQDSAQPISFFDWDTNGYWGTVYELEAGKTYYFDAYADFTREYAMYLHEVEVASDVTIPEQLSGKVNEKIWLEFSMDGAASTELTSSNEDVVILGGGNALGNEVFLVGEGTAVITCTDHNGNVDTCTVTVEGKKTDLTFAPYMFNEQIGLAAGESVTYSWIPNQSELYWIKSNTLSDDGSMVEISVADVNGEKIGYRFDRYFDSGIVCELTANSQYFITITSPVTQVFNINVEPVNEATEVHAQGAMEWIGFEGNTLNLSFQLGGNVDQMLAADLSVVSSDPGVVEVISYTGTGCTVNLVGEGTAQITVSLPNGASTSYQITCESVATVIENEAFDVTVAENGRSLFQFVPQSSGTYLVLTEQNQNLGLDIKADNEYPNYCFWGSVDEGLRGFICYDLKAGETYSLSFINWNEEEITNTYIIIKTGPVTSFEISKGSTPVCIGGYVNFKACFDSYMAMETPVQWTVTGDAEIMGVSEVECQILILGEGEITVTGTCGDFSDSCTIQAAEYTILKGLLESGATEGFTVDGDVLTYDNMEEGTFYRLNIETDENVTYEGFAYNGFHETTTILADKNGEISIWVRDHDCEESCYSFLEFSVAEGYALNYEVITDGDYEVLRMLGTDILGISMNAPATLRVSAVKGTTIESESGAQLKTEGKDKYYAFMELVVEEVATEAGERAEGIVLEALGNAADVQAYDIHLEYDGEEKAILEGDTVTVTLPIPEGWDAENVVIYHVSEDGKITDMQGTVDVENRTISFDTTHFSIFVMAEKVEQLETPVAKASNVASTGKIKISWAKVEGAESYEVYRSTDNKNWKLLKEVTGTSLTNTSAAAGTKYYYKVRAVAADGSTSEFSAVINRTCDLARPEVSVSNVASSGKIKLSWEKVDGAKSYKVYRSTDNETWSLLKETTGTSLTNTSTTAGKKYYYKVMAIHSTSAANSAYSSVVSRTCDLARPEVSVTNVASSGKIKLSWEKVEGAKSYKVYRSTDNKTWSLLKETTGTSLTNTSTTAGKKYYYKVMAVHSTSAANSAYSSVVSRTCDLARPTAEVSLNSKGKPVVSWNKVSGASKYKVYIYNSSGTLLKTSTTTSTKLTHSSAEKGKTYNYRVEAVHSTSAANSAKSVKVSIKSK